MPHLFRPAIAVPCRRAGWIATSILTVLLAACAQKALPPPPPPPPPPAPVEAPPPRPEPPDGAAPNLVVPEVDADGTRESVNRKISSNQLIWNLRSAYTVAALDCRDPRHDGIAPRYRTFLARNARVLKAVYDRMDREFRDRYGRGGETLRDEYLTTLYNHYALPPTMTEFCDVIDQVIAEGDSVPADGISAYATAKMPVIEKVFDDFYARYEKYKNALAAWEEKWGKMGRVSVGAQSMEVPARPQMPGAPAYGPVALPTMPANP